MHRFGYKKGELHCESVAVSKIAKAVGTPFYLYSIGTFLDHYFKLKEAFKEADPLICFSTKANSNLTVLKALVNQGAGLDVDALKSVAEGINQFTGKDTAIILITHYNRILNYVKPDKVHVVIDGKIAMSGDAKLALEVENRGYDWLKGGGN